MTKKLTPKESLEFLRICGMLKKQKRNGWIERNIDSPESVADHMYRMSMCSLLLNDIPGIDRDRCMRIALVHDLAESLVGDITPCQGILPSKKYRLELEAMEKICESLNTPAISKEIMELWKEYNEATTEEAKLVKDIDKFEMLLQADEYETEHEINLEDFFRSSVGKVKTTIIREWVNELVKQRKKRHLDIHDAESSI